MEGWISLHRSISNHWIFKDPKKFHAWCTILMYVNHTETKVNIKGSVMICKRGDSLNSLDTWAKLFGKDWNKSSVRRFLKLLESDSMIVTKSEHKTTRLTVCKYDSYQGSRNASETEMKRKRNADETQMTPNNNVNKEKNEKNDNKKNTIPLFVDFFNHAKSKIDNVSELSVKLKYDAWIENDWKDGNDKKINNWKSKLTNTVKYLDTTNAGTKKPRDRFDTGMDPAKFDEIPDKMH